MLRRFFLLVYMMRVPLITLLILGVALPLAFRTTMFHGVADIEDSQILGTAFLAYLLLSESITCAFLVLLYGEERADGWQPGPAPEQRVPLWSVAALYVLAAICYLVFLASIRSRMYLADPKAISLVQFIRLAAEGLVCGAVVALLVFFLVLRIAKPENDRAVEVFALPAFLIFRKNKWIDHKIRAVKKRPASEAALGRTYASHRGPLSSFLARILGPGYGTPQTAAEPAALHSGHRFALLLTASFFVFYIWTGRSVFHELLQPGPWSHQLSSVLFYLLLLIMFWCPLLCGLTFFFDRFRIPALVMLGLAFYVLAIPNSSDHQFDTVAQKHPYLHDSKDVFFGYRDKIIVVSAAGGGIQSAAWVSHVLCGLRHQVPQFSSSVAAISGVSGGSVGTMFYLKCIEGDPQGTDPADRAGDSSMEAVAWGLTHPDLRRAFLSGLMESWSRADRGWALEKALLKNAQFTSTDRLLTGEFSKNNWPIILLNSTNAETGDPLTFTNSDFPAVSGTKHQLNSFHSRYTGFDVRLETAVRMSAAFPYVSPVARPDQVAGGEHYADGGYFDNSGLFALSEWLTFASTPDANHSAKPSQPRPSILLLQIDAFPDSDPSQVGQLKKWYYQLYAPISTMLNVRSEGQIVRDITSGQDLQELLNGRGYATAWTKLRYKPDPSAGCPLQPPLSWHLTSLEKLCIQNAWKNISPSAQAEVDAFLKSEAGYFPASGCIVTNEKSAKGDSDKSSPMSDPIYKRRCAAK